MLSNVFDKSLQVAKPGAAPISFILFFLANSIIYNYKMKSMADTHSARKSSLSESRDLSFYKYTFPVWRKIAIFAISYYIPCFKAFFFA